MTRIQFKTNFFIIHIKKIQGPEDFSYIAKPPFIFLFWKQEKKLKKIEIKFLKNNKAKLEEKLINHIIIKEANEWIFTFSHLLFFQGKPKKKIIQERGYLIFVFWLGKLTKFDPSYYPHTNCDTTHTNGTNWESSRQKFLGNLFQSIVSHIDQIENKSKNNEKLTWKKQLMMTMMKRKSFVLFFIKEKFLMIFIWFLDFLVW